MPLGRLSALSTGLALALAAASASTSSSCGEGKEQAQQAGGASNGPVISTAAFGAVGDGTTLATPALQQALNAVEPGGTVQFAPGTYLIDSTVGLQVKDDTTLDLGNAVLTAPNVAGARSRILDIQGRKNVTIRGGTLVGSRSGSPQWGIGILASDADDLLIESVTFRDFYFDGITLTGNRGCRRVTIRNVVSENNRRTGLAIPAGSDILVENSIFRGSHGQDPEAGINVEPNAGGVVERIRLVGNTVTGNAGIGVYIHRALGVSVTDATVENSTIQDNEQGIVISKVEGVRLAGNQILRHTGKGGIVLGLATRGLIDDNRLEGNNHGIFSAGGAGVEIRGNRVIGRGPVPDGADEAAGITCLGLADARAEACVVSGNRVLRTAGSGVVAQSVAQVKLLDNTVEEAGLRGIYLRSTSGSEVRGNTITGSGVVRPRQHDGIEIALSSNNNVIAANTIRRTGSMRQPIGVGPGCIGNQILQNIVEP